MSDFYSACKLSDLVENSGVCALINGQQVAIFYLPKETPAVYVLDNWDPIGAANVLYRGILGDVQGQLVVASPLYKEHFSLTTGKCLEKDYAVRVWPVEIQGDTVKVQQPASATTQAA
ncbi:MAG: nitrite reductase small subunit NirD [Spongiibacteraceae bacterium]